MRTRDDIDRLHRAVNQLRETRVRLETLKKWSGDGSTTQLTRVAIETLLAKMAPVEGRLVQVKMTASEDNLRYPNMLNEQYDTFWQTIDSGDFSPTAPQRDVYQYLHSELSAALLKWNAILLTDLPAMDALLRRHGVPTVSVPGGML
jgi:hypothetical protein